MNVVAGLAGGYLLRDSFDTGSNPVLPGPIGTYELPIVVQDRQFNPDGSLLYPIGPASMHGPWIGEYFGDVMLVNGKIWPKLTVEPAVYRFRVLNGCNARIMDLRISTTDGRTAVPMVIIGTEGGLLPVNPAGSNGLVMTPAERYDVICDFRSFAGRTLLMTNTTPPGPVSTPAPPLIRVMQITVKHTASSGAPMNVPGPGSLPANPKVTELTSLGPPKLSGGSVAARMITLNEVAAETPRWKLNLNAHPYGDPHPVTETLTWNSVEDWYFVNTTPDTHPMHTHLVTFKVIGRYNYDAAGYAAKYGTADGVPQLDVSTLRPFLKSGLIEPGPDEAGLKETVKANPGQVTVVRARFSLPSTALNGAGKLIKPQKYVHHCHIVEHEDNDMMERMIVVP
jgi:FtsP/CotA-like multicopper oxidase with cupredoxin domain